VSAEPVGEETGPAPGGQRGAYGLRLTGLAGGAARLVPAPPEWPLLELVRREADWPARERETEDEADTRHARVLLRDDAAVIRLVGGGRIRLDREPPRATFRVQAPLVDEELLHPHLGGVAAIFAHWAGRNAFHAGGMVVDGRAWGVLGDRRSGKSSLLATVAAAGHGIVCDDVLVVDGREIFAGPRFIDLREDAAGHLGVGEPLGIVGARARWRVPLAAIPPAVPLAGWIVLAWSEGPEIAIETVEPTRRLPLLAASLTLGAPPREATALLTLAALPMLEFARPRDWRSAARVADAMADVLARS
jgi:hypothetical protein